MPNIKLFISTFILIFLAEIPDKTAFAILILASRRNSRAVFLGVCLAFAIQCFIAVAFGNFLSLLPPKVVQAGSACMFLIFAAVMWFKKEEPAKQVSDAKSLNASGDFWRVFRSSFVMIFIAEWGDLTQLITATLQAKYHQSLTLFAASTAALWTTTGLLVVVGGQFKRFVNPQIVQKMAALAFAAVGIYMACRAWQL